MDFSIAIRDLFVGDSKIFYISYIGISICTGIAFSGILLEFLYLKKIKKEMTFGIFEILTRIMFIGICVVVARGVFNVESDSIVKTPVGMYYVDQTKEIKEMNPKEIEEVVSTTDVQVLINSGVYAGIKNVQADKAYYEIEKWEVKGKRIDPIYVIVEKGTLN